MVQLFSNLPSELMLLKLTVPYFDLIKDNRQQSLLLVKELSKILSENDGNLKLEIEISKDLSCLVLLDALCQEMELLASHRGCHRSLGS